MRIAYAIVTASSRAQAVRALWVSALVHTSSREASRLVRHRQPEIEE
jgi:hypothetical protein